MFKKLFSSIKNYGVGKAIDSLDNLEPILAEKIEEQKKKINAMTSKEQSKWIIDEVQGWLRHYAKIPAK